MLRILEGRPATPKKIGHMIKLPVFRIGLTGASAIVIAGVCALGGAAFASPVQYGLNFYEFISADNITWSGAETAAEGFIYNGVNGHLATVTSAGENSFLASLVTSPTDAFSGAWLGGTAGYDFPGGSARRVACGAGGKHCFYFHELEQW